MADAEGQDFVVGMMKRRADRGLQMADRIDIDVAAGRSTASAESRVNVATSPHSSGGSVDTICGRTVSTHYLLLSLPVFLEVLSGGSALAFTSETATKKKADVVKHPEVFGHAGLLCNEPPGQAGLLFISSSDDSHSSFPRSRLPLLDGSLIPYIVPRESAIASKMSCDFSSYYAALDMYRLTICCGSTRAREVRD